MAQLFLRSPSNEPSHTGLQHTGRIRTNSAAGSSTDGRVEVQFHNNPQALAGWCKCLQSSPSGADAKETPISQPRLNIAIQIAGSRGDVQPFIPIAKLLSSPTYGHRVRICTHSKFKDFIESQDVEFFNLGGDPEALMAYMVKNPGLWPSYTSLKAGEVDNRRKEMWDIMNGAWRGCIEAGDGMGPSQPASRVRNPQDLFLADLIIANPPSMAHIHCAEKLSIPLHMVFTMPWSPTASFPHPLAAMRQGSADLSIANYISYFVVEMLTWEGLIDLINKLRIKVLHLDPVSPMWGSQLQSKLCVPYNYLWSSALVPKPADWGSHLSISGFSLLQLSGSYIPPETLTAFLQSGPPPIYIGFGSIVVHEPETLNKLVFRAIKLAGVRAIISKGWCGVGSSEDISDSVYVVGDCPHDWLFQRVSAVVHHGGAGTTAAGIIAGKPTVIVPFFGDQHFWGQMVANAHVGPQPVPYKELTAEKLAEKILIAMQPKAQEAAKTIARLIADEDGATNTVKDIQSRLNLEISKCDLCPERLAIWELLPTGIRLSGFAAACLLNGNLINPHDLRLLRQKHWYVEDGAKGPLAGGWAAISNLITAFEIATNDYLERLEKRNELSGSLFRFENKPLQASSTTSNGNGCIKAEADTTLFEAGHIQHDSVFDTANLNKLEAVAITIAQSSGASPMAVKHTSKSRGISKVPIASRPRGRFGKAGFVVQATGRYLGDVSKGCLKAPAAFCYNVANGFHNMTRYSFAHKLEPRRRGEIRDLKSGCRVACEELAIGVHKALTEPLVEPYLGARDGGLSGFAWGIYNGFLGSVCYLGVAMFALPGYTLKGLEKDLSRKHVTRFQIECILIRLRQAIDDYNSTTTEEKEQVIQHWNLILQSKGNSS